MTKFVICKRVLSEGKTASALQCEFNTHISEIIKGYKNNIIVDIIKEDYSYLMIFKIG